jgi:hypothetical protein
MTKKERPVFGFLQRHVLLAKHIRRTRLRAVAGSRELGRPAGRICCLFTISNIRAHPHERGGELDIIHGHEHVMASGRPDP